jgi:hypothetical protein
MCGRSRRKSHHELGTRSNAANSRRSGELNLYAALNAGSVFVYLLLTMFP